jgi:FlaA1/EpsC-like NDP-sugar epimerase
MRNRYILIADLLVFVLAALGAFVLRFDWFFPHFQREFVVYATVAVIAKPIIFYLSGMYRRYWRYASVHDLIALSLAVSASSVAMGLLVSVGLLIHVIDQFARSVVLIDWLLTLIATGGVRLSVRLIGESRGRSGPHTEREPRRLLIAGAGDAGAMVLREIQRNPQLGLVPIGFVDDDPAKIGKRVYGLPVFARTSDLAEVVEAHGIDEVTIAMPSAPGSVVRQVAENCQTAGVRSQIVPGVYELLDGNVSVSRLRNVDIVDLLRRTQVRWQGTSGSYVTGRTVLVTGAGGSIGLELCRQVAHRSPGTLILLGHGENSLFDARSHLHEHFPGIKLRLVVADIRNRPRITQVFSRLRPSIVFHAAAHKHVPLMEENPEEAISNNVLGTENIVVAALEAGTERLVLISSDKAVEPLSLMGASKRLAESIVRQAALKHGRAFVVVRFGNVLGSRGSVVPIFHEQIKRGGPLTITDPEMRRFFMTIPEAVALVLEAGGFGRGGELFVLRMGEPVRIIDLAQDLIRLSGLAVQDIPILYTGIRPGEKLEESLWEDGAELGSTEHPEVLKVSEIQPWTSEELDDAIRSLSAAVEQGNPGAIETILGRMIPTFAPTRLRVVKATRAV